MGQYDDISDAAYAEGGLETLTTAQRILFERTITAVGVAPTLRHRARRNLLIKFVEDGEGAVQAILDKSLDRAKRAEAWLANNGGPMAPAGGGLRTP
ncbi:hypothetical protein FHT76_000509 [Rhizobium sp. BK176]|nr:hypothetical protein [Rhizobium sp. BK176]